jgi:RNA polymerase sigma factor (sigma-70 family)
MAMITLEQAYVDYYVDLLNIAGSKFKHEWVFRPEDLVHELYFQVLKIRTRVVEDPLAYLSVMMMRLSYRLKKRWNLRTYNNADEAEVKNTFENLEQEIYTEDSDKQDVINKGIETLSIKRKNLLVQIMSGLSLREAAIILNESWRNIKALYYSALKKLREYVRVHYVIQ